MKNKCDCYHTKTKYLYTYNIANGQRTVHDVEVGICYGTKEMDECSCGGDKAKCNFYPATVSVEDAINHYKHGITHDIFSEPIISYATLAIEALEKQLPKKPVHIHEEHSEHLWRRDKNGEIDLWAFSAGYCNGPMCTRCYHVECEHCNEDWETDPIEPCVIDKDICPACGAVLSKSKYCPDCGQAIDWSE